MSRQSNRECLLARLVVLAGGQVPGGLFHIIDKQLTCYLEKWADKGWWDYGVSARSGWVTDNGTAPLRERAERAAVPAAPQEGD